MRIVHLYAENLLNLRAVSITPDRRVTRISGKNGAGKSNVLNALFYALAGKKGHADQPIRLGEQKATVRLELGEGNEVKLVVRLRITDSDAYLDVESPDGAVFRSPQAMLSAMIGNLAFDPQAFSRMKPAERLDTLRQLVKLDIDIDRLEELNEKDFTLRTEWNRKVSSLAERVHSLNAGIDLSLDVEPIDIAALTKKMAEASDHNAAIHSLSTSRERMRATIESRRLEAEEKRAHARRLLAEAAELDDLTTADEEALQSAAPLPEPIDVTALSEQINAATATNTQRESQRRQREALRTAEEELTAARTMAKNLTEAMAAREQQKADAIAKAKMPIAGLGFGNGDVTFNGLPFAQASSGQQLRIATSIGMALNPKLRVLCVRDGSLLDEESEAVIEELAEENDFQVLIEKTQSQATIGIHIVDGAVAAIDGVPVSAVEREVPAAL